MREIKFRVWDEINKKWLSPDSRALSFDGKVCFVEDQTLTLDESFPAIQQFTGLLDKNGKEIYEGDIVRYTQAPTNWAKAGGALLKVEWDEKYAFFILKLADAYGDVVKSDYAMEALSKYSEVIGNIYENPELLK